MGGGLVQLAAVGLQNTVLQNNKDGATFWRQRFVQHKHFAMESIDLTFTSKPSYGKKVVCQIPRSGDLLKNLVLEITLKKSGDGGFYPAEHLVREVELYIGGVRVDVVTNTWLRIYDELYRKVDEREAYNHMTNFVDEPSGAVRRFFLPLPFWFCTHPSSSLPLIALQYHDISLQITFEEAVKIPGIDPTFDTEITLWADYVYLDTDERRWFAQSPHNYLIEQTQVAREPLSVGATAQNYNITLPFNHPCKFLAWVLRPSTDSHGVFTCQDDGLQACEVYGPVAEVGMQFNGIDRFKRRKGAFFRLHHPWSHFGQAPSVGVYIYSFALHPKELSPSSTFNFSRTDSARLMVQTKAAVLNAVSDAVDEDQTLTTATKLKMIEMYARNYNVLRIQSGMAGVMFSN